jgi:hypothetical protein
VFVELGKFHWHFDGWKSSWVLSCKMLRLEKLAGGARIMDLCMLSTYIHTAIAPHPDFNTGTETADDDTSELPTTKLASNPRDSS